MTLHKTKTTQYPQVSTSATSPEHANYMVLAEKISKIFEDFADIFETIRFNDYSEGKKKEMISLFEEQTIKKCLSSLFDFVHFTTDLSSISDLVFGIVQEQNCGSFEAKELFLEIFEKAVALHEEEFKFLYETFNEKVIVYIDEIEDWKKKNGNLKDEIEILQAGFEEKGRNLVILENSYHRLNTNFNNLNEKWEEIVEENAALKNIISTLMREKDEEDEKVNKERLQLLEELKDIRQSVEEKDAQIDSLLEEKKHLHGSIELLKDELEVKDNLLAYAEFKQSEMIADYKDMVDTVPQVDTETIDNKAGEVRKIGDNQYDLHLVKKDEREDVQWKNDAVDQFIVASRDINVNDDEMEDYPRRKCLRVELLEALLSELSEDDSDHFNEEMLDNDQSDIVEDSKDSGVLHKHSSKSFESELNSMTPELIHLDRVVDIQTKLSDKIKLLWCQILLICFCIIVFFIVA